MEHLINLVPSKTLGVGAGVPLSRGQYPVNTWSFYGTIHAQVRVQPRKSFAFEWFLIMSKTLVCELGRWSTT